MKTKVMEAFGELNYVPHRAARALASRRSWAIGAVVPNINLATFAGMIQVLQASLYDAQYQLILATSEYNLSREFEQARTMIERRVDGLVLVGEEHHPELNALIARAGIPFVNAFSAKGSEQPCIGIDHEEASYRITQHLIELGHRRFAALINPLEGNDRVAARLDGVCSCLADHGIDLPDERIMEVPYGVGGGRMGFRALIQARPDITALVCVMDPLAIGAVLEANDMGIAVPERLSISGFDDLEMATHIRPRLTTIHNPACEIGQRVAEFILARIEGRQVPLHTKLEATVIIRESTGCPASMDSGIAGRDAAAGSSAGTDTERNTPASRRRSP